MIGQAFSLNGDSYVSVPDSASLAFTSAVTLDAWVNSGQLNFACTATPLSSPRATYAGARNYGLYVTSSGAVFLSYIDSIGDDVYITTAPGLVPAGSWTNIAGVIDTVTGVMEVFVNGTEVLSGQTNGAMVADSQPLTIGASDFGNNFFDGLIDEVQIYNRALASTDVQTLYADTEIKSAALASSALPGLAHSYPGQGNAADTSGGSNGAAHGTVTYAPGKVGEAFSFSGSSYVSIPSATSVGYTTAVTLDAWVDPTSLSFSSGYGVRSSRKVAYGGSGLRVVLDTSSCCCASLLRQLERLEHLHYHRPRARSCRRLDQRRRNHRHARQCDAGVRERKAGRLAGDERSDGHGFGAAFDRRFRWWRVSL